MGIASRLQVRPSIESDPPALAPRLRDQDLEEIRACTHLSPLEVLTSGLKGEHCHSMVLDGEVVAMFGVRHTIRSDGSVFGWIWLLASPNLPLSTPEGQRVGRLWLDRICVGCDQIGNVILASQSVPKR